MIKFSFRFISLIFIYLFFQNLLGLFPYSFPSTSHFFSSFIISMEMWLLSIFFSFSYNPIKFLRHYTPIGSPLFLTSFLKIVEAVSSLVRPIILSLRLAVNISTGHLLLGLLSGGTLSLGPFYFLPFSILLLLYLFIEYGVCLIQGIVFSLLLANYFEESL